MEIDINEELYVPAPSTKKLVDLETAQFVFMNKPVRVWLPYNLMDMDDEVDDRVNDTCSLSSWKGRHESYNVPGISVQAKNSII